MDPAEISKFLSEFLTPMTNVIFKHKGTLNKYMGDAIMAFWGAPPDQPEHALKACQTSLEMRAELKKLHAGWEQRGLPKFEIGIGLNTGIMAVGNMGSVQRFDYTLIGDETNLGSR